MDALALRPTYREQAQHCLEFALSLDATDPLALRMIRVARRFQLLAEAEAEQNQRRRHALIAKAHRLKEARPRTRHADARRPAGARQPMAPARIETGGRRVSVQTL